MKSITRALLIACLVMPIVACNKEEPQKVEAAPVAVPQTDDRTEWTTFLNDLAGRHMEGVNNSPYVYLVPPPEAAAVDAQPEETATPAEGDTGPELSTAVDGAYERLLDKAKTDVSRGITRGNLLIFAGLDSARTANLTVASFTEVPAGSMKGVRVLFVGEPADNDRVKAAVEPAGVEYVFVDTTK
ncbi:hypothetical protein LDO26_14585 [Luteimonas sp. BDR2-5]|uniref:hypothetical protein n=1 Tax=Proluteimonas luteida TaxID=2878685 RepID=UPI001E54B5FA|nr:hypothetical protein [Luteimonas sp. BDR2-5]MCD9029419.1 hypothetical protein [Luteimonas sp. BDR2-5]